VVRHGCDRPVVETSFDVRTYLPAHESVVLLRADTRALGLALARIALVRLEFGDKRDCGPRLTETCLRVPAGARGRGDSRGPIMSGSSRVATAGETVAQSRIEQSVDMGCLLLQLVRSCAAQPVGSDDRFAAWASALRQSVPHVRTGRCALDDSHRVSASGNNDSKAFSKDYGSG
jgi:hypothetical protein